MTKKNLLATVAAASVAGALAASAAAQAAPVEACLITKTDSNPYFVTMRTGAKSEARKLGVDLKTYAGKYDGDNQTQVSAIESCIADGAKGILITPSDTKAIVPTVEKARQAGLLVIALDTPLSPVSAADMTFATDNFQAGRLIGQWAHAHLGDKARDAKIAMLDLAVSHPTVGFDRDHGFLSGFGVKIANPEQFNVPDPRIVGHAVTGGAEEGGQKGMESLLARNPDITLVYAINEPAAFGAYQALKSVGKAGDVTIVAIDGSCTGVKGVKAGMIAADSQQYPLKMAALGVKAIADFAKTGQKPQASAGKDFYDTGTKLVTAHPEPGVPSITPAEGAKLCWGK
ncbi:substrate-binding domain-containing protein [Lichenicoccus sp.]|uniref:substrate-binding domain-containing protein n=1 Tax=Lichenicoccus sp. TaxID=2781899 RepID=UPI003D0EC3F8